MKSFKITLFVILFLFSSLAVYAAHGVTICGVSYNCGSYDSVCPEDYGADCGFVDSPNGLCDYNCGDQCQDSCGSGNVRYTDGYCYYSGFCVGYTSYDCDNLDGWYDIPVSAYQCCNGSSSCSTCQPQMYREYSCSGGSCVYSVTSIGVSKSGCTSCDDSNVCTTDSCNAASGACVNSANTNSCDDGLWCNGDDTCSGGSCSQHSNAPDCDDSNSCTDDGCDEAMNECYHVNNNDDCDDGLWCTINDACSGGSCNGAARDCSDSTSCNNPDYCDEGSNSCKHDGVCDCDEDSDCSGDQCNDGKCNIGTGTCYKQPKADGTSCSDGLWCNGADSCSGGSCSVHAGRSCSDSQSCTSDSCSEGSDSCVNSPIDNDNDGSDICSPSVDCNDGNANIKPGATELCNGVDDNCNGMADEPYNTYYIDTDSDGYGDISVSQQACSLPSGYVANKQDCDDGDPLRNPGETESCGDGIDNDCDGDVDCDDSNCACGSETCNGADDDMNGNTDFVSAMGDLDDTCGSDGCSGDSYVDYYCDEGTGCASDSDDCSDCSCSCGDYDTAESGFCSDGKDNDCDGDIDSADSECSASTTTAAATTSTVAATTTTSSATTSTSTVTTTTVSGECTVMEMSREVLPVSETTHQKIYNQYYDIINDGRCDEINDVECHYSTACLYCLSMLPRGEDPIRCSGFCINNIELDDYLKKEMGDCYKYGYCDDVEFFEYVASDSSTVTTTSSSTTSSTVYQQTTSTSTTTTIVSDEESSHTCQTSTDCDQYETDCYNSCYGDVLWKNCMNIECDLDNGICVDTQIYYKKEKIKICSLGCSDGKCLSDSILIDCTDDPDSCDDNNACTRDACSLDGYCENIEIEGCNDITGAVASSPSIASGILSNLITGHVTASGEEAYEELNDCYRLILNSNIGSSKSNIYTECNFDSFKVLLGSNVQTFDNFYSGLLNSIPLYCRDAEKTIKCDIKSAFCGVKKGGLFEQDVDGVDRLCPVTESCETCINDLALSGKDVTKELVTNACSDVCMTANVNDDYGPTSDVINGLTNTQPLNTFCVDAILGKDVDPEGKLFTDDCFIKASGDEVYPKSYFASLIEVQEDDDFYYVMEEDFDDVAQCCEDQCVFEGECYDAGEKITYDGVTMICRDEDYGE